MRTPMTRPALFAACMVMLAACSSKPADPVATPAPTTRQPTVIDPQLKALEDAKAVQATLDEAERKRRKDLDDSGG